MHRSGSICFGAAGGFTLTALADFVARVDWISLIGLVGSITSTVIAWYIARRQELARTEVQVEHMRRQAKRDELLEDLAAELKAHRARIEAGLPTPPPAFPAAEAN